MGRNRHSKESAKTPAKSEVLVEQPKAQPIPPPHRWTERVTLIVALWGAIVATGVAIIDVVKAHREAEPEFYVRVSVDLSVKVGNVPDAKPVNKIEVRITNIGIATATLDPNFIIDGESAATGAERRYGLYIYEPHYEGKREDVPLHPVVLTTGEEAAASLYPPDIGGPSDSLVVRFRLIEGRAYSARIPKPTFTTGSAEAGNLSGWASGVIAKPDSRF